jgi:hypothetical protein
MAAEYALAPRRALPAAKLAAARALRYPHRMKRVYALLLGVVGLAGCHKDKGGGDASDEHLADAKVVLGGFVKPNADQAALSTALRPKPEDYDAVFVPDAAKKLKAELDPRWDSGKLVLRPKAEQSELFVAGATSDQLKTGTGGAAECPGRYQDIADMIKPGNRLYCFRFRKPGEKTGFTSDGLVWLKDHWAIFPHPYRILGAKRDAPAGSGHPAPAGSAQPAPAGSGQP